MTAPFVFKHVISELSARPCGPLLDIPAGRLEMCWVLSGRGFECVAADLSLADGEEPMPDGKTIRRCRVDLNQSLPFPAGAFQYVLCVEGLEHVENTFLVLRELHRVLRPGGEIFITTPNILNIQSRMRFLLSGTYMSFPHLTAPVRAAEHAHINPVAYPMLDFALRQAGFDHIVVHRVHRKWKLLVYAPILLMIKFLNVFPRHGQSPDSARIRNTIQSTNFLMSDAMVVSARRAA
ncbi:MAG: hypothetical protein A3G34_09530 [Candidatus Lindowbacteria bacterium RIFCSPLOWO2_12_FULL_62_27]|nr:MAG: hypothetical protein A3G34_09530 [Candidatus Lindowbacteria bacterium RIFCSPLOWO2_12_FULL_62_27]